MKHTRTPIQARFVLLLIAVVSASSCSKSSPRAVEPSAQSAVRWELVRPVTPEGLANCEALMLRGTSPVPFHLPRPEHFHLDRMGEMPVWIPMMFGWPLQKPGVVEIQSRLYPYHSPSDAMASGQTIRCPPLVLKVVEKTELHRTGDR